MNNELSALVENLAQWVDQAPGLSLLGEIRQGHKMNRTLVRRCLRG